MKREGGWSNTKNAPFCVAPFFLFITSGGASKKFSQIFGSVVNVDFVFV